MAAIDEAVVTTDADAFAWRDIQINTKAIGEENTSGFRVGKLHYRGGLVLTSPDENFGGFSAMRLSDDGTELLAVSDRAQWLSSKITMDSNGAISGLENARMSALMGEGGNRLKGLAGDAEGLSLSGDKVLVSFERFHRVDQYQYGASAALTYNARIIDDTTVVGIKPNQSLEAVEVLRDGRILTIAEGASIAKDKSETAARLLGGRERPGWLSSSNTPDDWQLVAYETADEFSVTDTVQDKTTGDLYILERAFSRQKGVRARITRIAETALQAGTLLQGEELARLTMLHGIDNMEGLTLNRRADGQLMVYIISDDNFNLTQRTVLQSWEVTDRATLPDSSDPVLPEISSN